MTGFSEYASFCSKSVSEGKPKVHGYLTLYWLSQINILLATAVRWSAPKSKLILLREEVYELAKWGLGGGMGWGRWWCWDKISLVYISDCPKPHYVDMLASNSQLYSCLSFTSAGLKESRTTPNTNNLIMYNLKQ